MTRVYDIWCEGYAATGEHGTAFKFGSIEGASFRDACVAFFRNRENAHYFNPEYLTYWGCRLFDNEADARKSWG